MRKSWSNPPKWICERPPSVDSTVKMSEPNIWICPASLENLELTIKNPHNGKYAWAFNAKKRGQWNRLQIGDMCLFGNLKKPNNLGYKYISYVIGKEEISDTEDKWSFRSPSGTAWRYVFYLTPPVEVNITKQQFLNARPAGSPQTQIMAKGDEADKLRRVIEAATIDRATPI